MPSAQFKLSKHNGVTRRITFDHIPSWKELASRIGILYDIPVDRVAVSYIDDENDEVTLSTEEELQQYYMTCHLNEVTKLFVQDLASIRSQTTSTVPPWAQAEERVHYRNTFGEDLTLEDDWQLPWDGVFITRPNGSTRHGFVEEVETGSEAMNKGRSESNSSTSVQLDKGKAKAETEEMSSTASLVDEVSSPKHPIHVYDVSARHAHDANHNPVLSSSPSVQVESTPKATPTPVANQRVDPENNKNDLLSAAADDPPLPEFQPQPSPSLSHDLSNLFSALGNVVASHPEVSDGFRNIVRNSTNGSYWRAHRDAISKAAADITQASGTATQEALRSAEEEAGRRVMAAFDQILRTLSEVSGAHLANRPSNAAPSEESNNTSVHSLKGSDSNLPTREPPEPKESETNTVQDTPAEHPPRESAGSTSRTTEWQSFLNPIYPSVPPVPYPWQQTAQSSHNVNFHNLASFFSPPTRQPFISTGMPPVIPPPPPPPPAIPVFPPQPFPPSGPIHTPTLDLLTSEHQSQESAVPFAGPSSGTAAQNNNTNAPQALDSKVKLEKARANYRAEKARYREERKRNKGTGQEDANRMDVDVVQPFEGLKLLAETSEAPVTQVVSNARGPFPQLEMISIPHNLNQGPSLRRRDHDSFKEDLRSRAVKRICKQLADMGFTESQHPGLSRKVSARLPEKGVPTKDAEDEIVTNLIEELLLLPSNGSVATGSGQRR